MINRPEDLGQKEFLEGIARLAAADPEWVVWGPHPTEPGHYAAVVKDRRNQRLMDIVGAKAGDRLATWTLSLWLAQGPKIFRPTPEQCRALEQVEVRLPVEDYAQPYPVLCVDLPAGMYAPFECVLCNRTERGGKVLVCFDLLDRTHECDIVTTVTVDGRSMEESIVRYDADCQEHREMAARVLRVAINSCLALVHFGSHLDFLYPKEVARDRGLTERHPREEVRQAARLRVRRAPRLVTFSHEVVLHHDARGPRQPGEPTGREMPFHWRRGCWAMQTHGPGRTLRKRILRKPCKVRPDKMLGAEPQHVTIYTTPARKE